MADNQRMGFEEAVLQRIGQQIDPMADAVSEEMGMPPGGTKYSQAEIDKEWNVSPIADPQARAETMLQLKNLGKTDEEITDMVYPKRRRVITTSRPQVAEQIKFAQQQARRMQQLAAQQQIATPVPTPLDQPMPPTPAQQMAPMTGAPPPQPSVMPQPGPPPMAPAAGPSMLDQPAMPGMLGG